MRARPDRTSVTLEHVATAAGVSRATVSRVINNVGTVDAALQESVQRAIAATGYVPNQAARSLVTRRTGSIAFVVSEPADRAFDEPFAGRVFTDPFFGRVVVGIMSVLRPRGVNLVLMLVENDAERTRLMGYLRQGHVDGIILNSAHADDPLPRMLSDAGVCAVLSRRPTENIAISFVEVAQRTGAALAADRLVARGCRNIATITGPLDMAPSVERLAGFRDAMARHGVAYVHTVEGHFTQDSGWRAMEQLLTERPETDGVFVASDLMAQGALLALHDRGVAVPADIAVVGFDDSVAATACRPPLTTVRQPVEDMAAQLAQLLLEAIDDRETPVRSVIVEPTLVVRGSA